MKNKLFTKNFLKEEQSKKRRRRRRRDSIKLNKRSKKTQIGLYGILVK